MTTAHTGVALPGFAGRKARTAFLVVTLFIALTDGFDLSVFGVTLPVMIAKGEWGITSLTAGTIASAQLFGMLVGSLVLGYLADRFGKKTILLCTLVLYAIATLAVIVTPNVTVFTILRFVAGIGIGGVLLILIALVSELSLPDRRYFNNTIMLSGSALGGAVAPLTGALLLIHVDFRVLYTIGGVAALVMVPFAIAFIPESPNYLRLHGRHDRATTALKRMGLEQTTSATAPAVKARVRELFVRGLRARTIMSLVAAIFVFSLSTAFPTWFPQYLVLGGVELSNALLLVTLLALGAIVGPIIGGRLQDKGNAKIVVAVYFLCAALTLAGIALLLGAPVWMIMVLIFLFGAFNSPFLFNGLIANAFPVHLRGTMLGVEFAAGRTGAVVAASFGGWVASAGLPPAWNLIIWALVPLAAALVIFVIPVPRRDADGDPGVGETGSRFVETAPTAATETRQ
jgi:AAHS family benzoate transporter-like MFS transporter